MPASGGAFLVTVGALAAASALGVAYLWLIRRRNRRLRRPPILGFDGSAIPERTLTLSDGEIVDYVIAGPTDPGPSPAGAADPGPPVIVLVPGADGMKETFRFQVPAFARRYRVACASLRRNLEEDDTLDRMVDDVLELATTIGADRFVLLGQSLGGAIALRLAARFPERVQGLVLANTLARIGYDHVGLNRTLFAPLAMATTRYLPTAAGRFFARFWSRLDVWIYDASPGRDRVIDYALWTGPRTVPSSVSNARVDRLRKIDLRAELPSIQAPTLVLKGPRDHYVPPEASAEIVSRIPGAEYREVAGTGHCSHVSMPGSFNALVIRWLREAVTEHGRSEPSRASGSDTEVEE